jgi:hypothetical protein
MTGDYHGQMNHKSFSDWMSVKVIPNFLPQTFIVFNSAPNHSYRTQKASFGCTNKQLWTDWLKKNAASAD